MRDQTILWTIAALLLIANVWVWVMDNDENGLVELFCCECTDGCWRIGMRWPDGYEKVLGPCLESEIVANVMLMQIGELLQGDRRQLCH